MSSCFLCRCFERRLRVHLSRASRPRRPSVVPADARSVVHPSLAATCVFPLLLRIAFPHSAGVWLCLYIKRKANSHRRMSRDNVCERDFRVEHLPILPPNVNLRKMVTSVRFISKR